MITQENRTACPGGPHPEILPQCRHRCGHPDCMHILLAIDRMTPDEYGAWRKGKMKLRDQK